MKFATKVLEDKSVKLSIYSDHALTDEETLELQMDRGLIFSRQHGCFQLTGNVSFKDISAAKPVQYGDKQLYEVAEADLVEKSEARLDYCPFQKGFKVKA